jgi:hypothetical protein
LSATTLTEETRRREVADRFSYRLGPRLGRRFERRRSRCGSHAEQPHIHRGCNFCTRDPRGRNLIGANIGDTYIATLAHGIVFNQGLVVTPSFNTPSAYSALATAGLTFPVYKRLGFNLSALDDFLNDPAFGSKKNSFQFSAGITYTLK